MKLLFRKYWLFLVPLSLVFCACPLTTANAQDDYVRVSGAAINNSVWSNNPSLTPPHWHVAPTSGSLTNQVRILVAAYIGTDLTAEPSATYYVNPTNPFSPALTVTDPPLTGGNYMFLGIERGASYTIIGWIDGNENFLYDEGEPCGKRVITPASDVSGLVLLIEDDSDDDGMEDWWEAHWFGSLKQRAETDYDNDGLANIEEYAYIFNQTIPGILPNNWDSDGDGMDDDWEIFYGMSPVSNVGVEGGNGHRDGDGLKNSTEYRGPDGVGPKKHGFYDDIAVDTGSRDATDPNRSDTDDDGVNDNTEIFTDLTHPVHPMSSRNYKERSLMMNAGPVVLTDPVGNIFSPGDIGWTVEFWIYPETDGNGIVYSFTNSAGGDEFQIAITNFRPEVIIDTGAGNVATIGGTATSIAELPSNQWSQIAIVWAPDNNSLGIWVDNVLVVDALLTFAAPYLWPGGVTILQDFTDGYFDELKTWNYPRSSSEIQYWSTRLYPSPERLYPSANTPVPPAGYLALSTRTKDYSTIFQNYLSFDRPLLYYLPYNSSNRTDHPLCGYYRFDDAGSGIENFAFLNVTNFYLTGPVTNGVTDAQAVTLSGSDDVDGDGIPEWWAALHNLEQYQEYYSSQYGPKWNGSAFEYFRSFVAYTSIGNLKLWVEDETDPGAVYHYPKTIPDFCIADQACFTKDIYLHVTPLQATLSLFTPGMASTIAYINGNRITSSESEILQVHNIANYLKVGRNRIYVRCQSETENISLSTKLITVAGNDNLLSYDLDLSSLPSSTARATGKFDASLVCDNVQVIVRGDLTRGDPRSVWHCQLWTTAHELDVGNMPMPDRELRVLPGNTEYGLPFNAERDNNPLNPDLADDSLDAYYEYISRTNPRDKDSNDNGITDGDEDFDHDGLINSLEQVYGSDPWLPDTDDDGTFDGADRGTDGHPSASLSPQNNLSLQFGGTANDYLTFPKNQRFAMEEWSLEAWVKPNTNETDGGIIIQRLVAGTNAINYELGLGDGIIAPVNVPYVRFLPNTPGATTEIAIDVSPISTTGSNWTHLAATYYSSVLNLFVNGTKVATKQTASGPAITDRGPIIQQIGTGLKGCLDEVRIWNIKLEPEQIFNNLTEVYSGNQSTLVAYYRFDDNTSYGTNSSGNTVGTSANNVTNIYNSSVDTSAPWLQGQVEDYVLAYSADWLNKWAHAASIYGNVSYSTDHAVVGPPRLQVFLESQQAVAAGAMWSVDGGFTWKNSSYLETHLSSGNHTLSFKPVDGWVAPASTNVTLIRDTLTVMTNTYHQTATLTVTLNPSAVIAQAQWTIDNGLTWHYSGATEDNMVGGTDYYIQFLNISSIVGFEQYSTPTNVPPIVLDDGEERSIAYQYSLITGSVRALIEPTNVQATARWRITGSTNWNVTGVTVSDLGYGDHDIEFYDVAGYVTPATDTIRIESDTLIIYPVTYEPIPEPTSISVTILPAAARTAGAQWRADSESWLNSGGIQLIGAGTHTVTFKSITGWLEPSPASVTVVTGVQSTVSATYYQGLTTGTTGTDPGKFKKPRGVAATDRYLYVSDSDNNRIQVMDLATMKWSIIGGPGTAAGQLKQPFGLAVDADGNLWVADAGNHRIQMKTPAGIWTTWGGYGTGTGKFNGPFDIDIDSNGNVYVADHYNNRVQKLSSGAWSVFVQSGLTDGKVTLPAGIMVDSTDRIYVSDYNSSTGISRIQRFDQFGSLVNVVGTSTTSEGGLSRPAGMDMMSTTNLLVADMGNSRLRQLNISASSWSDRIGSSILNAPRDVAVNPWGNIYIADTGNDRILILPAQDSDSDGIPNAIETSIYGTNPNSKDSDGDTVSDWHEVRAGTSPTNALSFPAPTLLDFDKDGISDLCLYYPPSGSWYIMQSTAGFQTRTFGYAGTVPLVGDFDGDAAADYGCYDASGNYGQPPGSWYIMQSTAGFQTRTFGYAGTVAIVGDFDGDGIDDYGCYDASGNYGQPPGSWYIMQSTAGFITRTFGYAGTVPIVGDFDGDGIDDYGCYDAAGNYGQPPGSWYIMQSTAGFITRTFGYAGTVPVVGDFDGDGIDDYGCYDAAGNYGQPPGSWYIMQSTAGFQTRTFGYAGTVPVVGDFTGNTTDNIGVYSADSGRWYISIEPAGTYQATFGYPGTIPPGKTTQ